MSRDDERYSFNQPYVKYFHDGDTIGVRHGSAGRALEIPISTFRAAIIQLIGMTAPAEHQHHWADIIDPPTIPAAQVQANWTQTNSAALDYILNKPAARSQSSASRTLNSAFQVSTTRDAMVSYSVEIGAAASLTGGQTGTVFLEIANDAAFTSGVQEIARFVNGNSVSLAIAITVNQNICGVLAGYVPAGKYARLRTANTAGTPSFNYRSGQEALL